MQERAGSPLDWQFWDTLNRKDLLHGREAWCQLPNVGERRDNTVIMRIRNSVYWSLLTLAAVFCSSPVAQASSHHAAQDTAFLNKLSDSFQHLAEKVGPAVVRIVTTGFGPAEGSSSGVLTSQQGSGSGIILDRDGYIITNAHVVEGTSRIRVVLATAAPNYKSSDTGHPARSTAVPAKMIGIDSDSDLALLKIDETNLPTLDFGDSDQVKQGQLAFAFGSPLGLDNSVTLGVISSPTRQLDPDDPMVYIQTDAPINPGNSGGPLVDVRGKLIGINTFILTQSGGNEGIGFAAPSNVVKNVYEQLKKDGHVHRGFVGVQVQAVNPTLAAGLRLAQDWGVMLSDVLPGGPAEKAGLKIGDIVLKIGSKSIENVRDFRVALYEHPVDESVDFAILRGQQDMSIPVKLIQRTNDPNRFVDYINKETNLIPEWGIFVVPVNGEIAGLLPILRKPAGVVVAGRVAGPNVVAEFMTADLICELNNEPVRDVAGLKAAIAKLHSGDPVVVQLQRQGQLMFITFEMP
jgi:serine protease Do